MNKPCLSTFTKKLGGKISQKSPTILSVIAVTGLVGSVIFAVRATPKALKLLEQERDIREDNSEDGVIEPLTKPEIAKIVWKCYIPTAVICAVTAACILGSNSISNRRINALAGVYGFTEAAFREYRAKVAETIGEKKEKGVRDAVAKDRIGRDPVENHEVLITGDGNALCYDVFSGRYFKSDSNKLRKVENLLNKQLLSDMHVCINDLYYEIGLPDTKMGGDLGWSVADGLIDFQFSSHLASDGTPCLVIDYTVAPRYDYRFR